MGIETGRAATVAKTTVIATVGQKPLRARMRATVGKTMRGLVGANVADIEIASSASPTS
jgi:hypothetical protein